MTDAKTKLAVHHGPANCELEISNTATVASVIKEAKYALGLPQHSKMCLTWNGQPLSINILITEYTPHAGVFRLICTSRAMTDALNLLSSIDAIIEVAPLKHLMSKRKPTVTVSEVIMALKESLANKNMAA
ncbi:hypothetical protein BBP40_003700 [Aspergillus hancockii]|nr:hypothetical protein BBP40_003700 [Aspergillus hancockii]